MHISTLRQWLRHGSFASHQEMRVQTIHSCLAALMSCTCTPDIATCAASQYYAVHSVIQWCGHEQPFLSLFPPSVPPPPPLLCQVYHRVHGLPVPSMGERLLKHYRLGPVAGGVFVALISLVIMWYLLVCLWRPANAIQRVPSMAQTMSLHEAQTRKPS